MTSDGNFINTYILFYELSCNKFNVVYTPEKNILPVFRLIKSLYHADMICSSLFRLFLNRVTFKYLNFGQDGITIGEIYGC